MQIDSISEKIVTLALFLDKKTPGLAAEIWIPDNIKDKLIQSLDSIDVDALVLAITKQLNSLVDMQRNKYLGELFESLKYQMDSKSNTDTYLDFSKATFGFPIERVTEQDINKLEFNIHSIENRLGKTREVICRQYNLSKNELLPHFAHHIETITSKLPAFLFNFPDEGVTLKLVENKPWSAFNSHNKPYQSEVSLNADVGLTDLDLYRLACHEVCGGHHTELSNKDQMLTMLQRGEHGLVVTFSPQTFVSEAIAESLFELMGILDYTDDHMMITWHYDRLVFALQNLATHLFFDDKMSRTAINEQFTRYAISDQSRKNLLDFSCDPLYGRYAPVYHSGYHFLKNLYDKSNQKEKLIKTLFSQPCTPQLLSAEFLPI